MKLSFTTDNGYASDTALGLIVLQTDETIEPELRKVMVKANVPLYHSRIPNADEVTPETLGKMEQNLPEAAKLLPTHANLKVVGYGCTSGATVIGADKVEHIIQQYHPNAKATNPITAVIAALNHLGAQKIGYISPYILSVSQAMMTLLEENGFEIGAFASFEAGQDSVVARISEQSTYDAIIEMSKTHDVDAFFTSCTNLRSFNIIGKAEAVTGKPVISSNSALAWHMLELAGIESNFYTQQALN